MKKLKLISLLTLSVFMLNIFSAVAMANPKWSKGSNPKAPVSVAKEAEKESNKQNEVKGVFDAVYGNTITVFTVGKESKEFTLANDVYVILAGKKAAIGDLKKGNVVNLKLNSDKVVVSIKAAPAQIKVDKKIKKAVTKQVVKKVVIKKAVTKKAVTKKAVTKKAVVKKAVTKKKK
ncbi:MAG: hypothetical protein ACYC4E_02340 [Carboxydocellales bacterium]